MNEENLKELMAELNLTPAEEAMVRSPRTDTSGGNIYQGQILAQLHISKQLEMTAQVLNTASGALQVSLQRSTEKVIESNEKLATAADRTTHRLVWLTWVLVGLTVVLVGLAVVTLLQK